MKYLKCIVGNRVTLCGFILFIPSIVGIVFFFLFWQDPNSAFITLILLGLCSVAGLFFGFILLYLTALGLDTYKAYKKAIHHILKFGKVDKKYKLLLTECYCSQIGIKIAAKEMGLKEEVKKVDCDDSFAGLEVL